MPELCFSCAVGEVCCERCHSAASSAPVGPPISTPKISSRPARNPTRYALRVRSIIAAFERTSEHVVGHRSAIGGLGDPAMPLTGYCPVCESGVVAVRVIDGKPVQIDVENCDAGCDWRQIAQALR